MPCLRRKNEAQDITEDCAERDYPLFCPKCRPESMINVQNFQIEKTDQPDAETQC